MKRRNLFEKLQLVLAALSIGMLVVPAQAIETAGEVFVNLDASSNTAGTASWENMGSLGDFSEVGDPIFGNVGGTVPAVIFDGGDDAYTSVDNAPAGLVGVDPTRTIEAWVFNPSVAAEETIVSWGKRGGPDGSNMSFNYGNHSNFGAVGHWGGGTADMGWIDNTLATTGAPDALKWHHLVYTYDGTTTRVYSDGVLSNSEDLGAGVINTHPDTKIAVASQIEGDGVNLTGGLKGSMAISKLRIHDGVLSDAQILSNYNEEKDSFPNPIIPTPSDPVAAALSSGPIHRYSFNNDAAADATGGILTDSVGGAHGDVKGAGSSFTGSRLRLNGGPSDSAAYGDLPNGLISKLQSTTVEGWVGIEGSQTWQRIFDFGSNDPGGVDGEIVGPGETNGAETAGLDYFLLSANRGDNVNQQRVEIRNEDPAGGGIVTIDSDVPTDTPQDIHFAVVFEEGAANLPGLPEFGTSTKVSHYRDGELVAQGTTTISLSEINDVNNWLGRSNWTGDANFEGSYDEFRIYDRALSHDEILGNVAAGPDVVNVVPEPGSLLIMLTGILGLSLGMRRRRRK